MLLGVGGDSLAWSPDGKRLATAGNLWDAETGKELLTLSGHVCVAWSPDGKRLATGNGDRAVMLWDAETGEELLTLDAFARSEEPSGRAPPNRTLLRRAVTLAIEIRLPNGSV